MPAGGFLCRQFPDPKSPLHTVLAGLICAAVVLPVRIVLGGAFARSSEPELPNLRLGWPRPLQFVLGKQTWRFARCRPSPVAFAAAKFAHETSSIPGEAIACALRRLGNTAVPVPSAPRGRRASVRTGILMAYAAWAAMAWFVFAYGRLVHDMLGPGAEEAYVKSWLAGVGMDHVRSFEGAVREAVKVALVVSLLEPLLVSKMRWYEEYLDFLSVQATMFTFERMPWWRRMRRHVRHYAYVVD
jgi:hypothetical protein